MNENVNYRQKSLEMPTSILVTLHLISSLDFNKTLVNGSVLNLFSINNIRFFLKSLFKKLSAFEVI